MLNFSSETMQARRMQSEIFKVFREKSQQPVPGEITFQKWRTNKDFLRQKLREFVASASTLQEMLKEVLFREEK